MKFSGFKKKRWLTILGSTYILILIMFSVWMIFFDTNSYFIQKELDDEIEALEGNKEFYKSEIEKDKVFLNKMEDSNEMEKYAREKYYLKKEGEDIFIIENEDSLK
jgi:cell division protein DivIC